MRTPAFLIAAVLAAPLGLAAVAPDTQGTAPPHRVERVDPTGLTPAEWLEAMMAKLTSGDPSEARRSAFHVPPGHLLVGRVVDGSWSMDVLPDDAPGVPTVDASEIEPGSDCLNDVVDYEYGSLFPITANLLYPVTPNVASLEQCTGAPGLAGPVNYVSFRTAGDSGGWMGIGQKDVGYLEVGCAPAVDGMDAAGAGAGVGVGDVWRTTFEASDTMCYVWTFGAYPSEFQRFEGNVMNWNYYYGDAYASVLTSGPATGGG